MMIKPDRHLSTLLFFCLALASLSALGKEAPSHIDGAYTVDADRAYQLFRQGAFFIDVRQPKAYELGRIPGAFSLPLGADFTEERLARIASPGDDVVIYCGGPRCPLSARAVERVLSWEYRHVHYFRAGLPGWQKAGYPVE